MVYSLNPPWVATIQETEDTPFVHETLTKQYYGNVYHLVENQNGGVDGTGKYAFKLTFTTTSGMALRTEELQRNVFK